MNKDEENSAYSLNRRAKINNVLSIRFHFVFVEQKGTSLVLDFMMHT